MSDQIKRTPVCSACAARCCTFKRWIFSTLRLSPQEADMPRFKPHVRWGRRFGEKEEYPYISLDPKCPFLRADNQCGIYRHRPSVCKSYICYQRSDIMEHEKGYPTHFKMLKQWQVLPGQKYGMPVENNEHK